MNYFQRFLLLIFYTNKKKNEFYLFFASVLEKIFISKNVLLLTP